MPTHDEEVDVSAEEEIPATQADVEVSGEDVESPGANDKGTFQARGSWDHLSSPSLSSKRL